jgi:hypothetical protein
MKKIMLAFAMLFAVGSTMYVSAQDQKQDQAQQRIKFYYYPSSNVYYNISTGDYWYYDEPTVKWVEVKTLPETITLDKTPVYTIYYNGPDVWKENAEHQKKYKSNKNETKKKGQ